MNKFKKSDLKTGMRVETRSGRIYLVLKDIPSSFYGVQEIGFVCEGGFICGENYNDDLIHESNSGEFDIVKVYTVTKDRKHLLGGDLLDLDKRFLLWDRYGAKKLTKNEIEELLGYKIEIVE